MKHRFKFIPLAVAVFIAFPATTNAAVVQCSGIDKTIPGNPLTNTGDTLNANGGLGAAVNISFQRKGDATNGFNFSVSEGSSFHKLGTDVEIDSSGRCVSLPKTDSFGQVIPGGVYRGDALAVTYTQSEMTSVIQSNITKASVTAALGADPVLYDSAAHDVVTLGGAGAGSVRVTNLTDGAVAAGSKDAVNGGQLYNVQAAAGAAQSTANTALINANNAQTAAGAAQNTANTALATANLGWNLSVNGGPVSNIGPGGTMTANAGSNIALTQNGTAITVSVVDNPTFGGMLTANGGMTVGTSKTVNMGGNVVQGVAAGTLSSTSTDGVNGSQLFATGNSIANALGGGSTYNPSTATVTAPTFEAGRNPDGSTRTVNNVADALAALAAQDEGSVKYDFKRNPDRSLLLDAGGKAQRDYASVTMGADPATGAAVAGGTKITNVAPAAVTAASMDAVNGSQLFTVANAIGAVDGNGAIIRPTYNVYGNTYNSLSESLTALQTRAPVSYVDSNGQATTTPTNTVKLQGADPSVPVTLQNVADGQAPTDAANVRQVQAVAAAVSSGLGNVQAQIDEHSTQISANRKIAASGIAAAIAMQTEAPNQHPGEFAVSGGVGYFDGAAAVGISGNYLFPNGKMRVGVGLAKGSKGSVALRAGFGMAF